jgi:calcineurin-like phosphoesterase family protein
MIRSSAVCLILTALLVAGGGAQEPGPNSLFLDGDIEIDVRPDGDMVVSWQTLEPTPAGTLWIGLAPDDASPAFPRYRSTARIVEGDEVTTAHAASWEISSFERGLYDVASLRANGGGVIQLRLVTWSLEGDRNEIFHTRIGYARSEEGVYRRVPCITLGPVVDCVTDTSAVISWETDLPAHCNLSHRVGDGTQVTEMRTGELPEEGPVPWEWEIEGLEPETEVTYSVLFERSELWGDLPTSSREFTFRTAPEVGSDAPFQFALMSDSRAGRGGGLSDVESTNWAAARDLMNRAYQEGADVILFAGDLVNGYTASVTDYHRQLRSWRDATAPVGSLVPIFEGVGNHEYCGPAQEANQRYIQCSYTDGRAPELLFSQHFVNPANGPGPEQLGDVEGPPYAETVYSFDWGNAHFVSINSNYWWMSPYGDSDFSRGNREGFVMDGQLKWLDADLADARERGQRHLFVYTHEPMFPNGGHVGDSMYWGGRIPEVLEMRARLAEILSRHGVLAVIHGDEHNCSRMLVTSEVCETVETPFWQIISGGAGAPFYGQDMDVPWSEHVDFFSTQNHFVFVEVDGDDVTARVIARSGQVLDVVSLTDAIEEE